jgi:hypothetical protein
VSTKQRPGSLVLFMTQLQQDHLLLGALPDLPLPPSLILSPVWIWYSDELPDSLA